MTISIHQAPSSSIVEVLRSGSRDELVFSVDIAYVFCSFEEDNEKKRDKNIKSNVCIEY